MNEIDESLYTRTCIMYARLHVVETAGWLRDMMRNSAGCILQPLVRFCGGFRGFGRVLWTAHQAAEAAAIPDGKQVALGVLFQCGQIRTSSKDGCVFQ